MLFNSGRPLRAVAVAAAPIRLLYKLENIAYNREWLNYCRRVELLELNRAAGKKRGVSRGLS